METEKAVGVIQSSSVPPNEDFQPDETIQHQSKEEEIKDDKHEEKEEETTEIKANPSPLDLEKVHSCCFSQMFRTWRKEQMFTSINGHFLAGG